MPQIIILAHLMVNSMAVCVGTPRDSNHVYNRAFDLKKLERSKGPGSDFHHENWDCGVGSTRIILYRVNIL